MGLSGLLHGYTRRALWLARGLEPGLCGLWGLPLWPTDGIDPAAVSIGELRRAEPRGNRLHREGERRAEQNQLSGGRRLQRRRAAAAAAAALAALAVAWLS